MGGGSGRVTTKPASAHHRLRQSRSWAHAQSVGNTALFSVEQLNSGPQHTRKSFQAPELQGGPGQDQQRKQSSSLIIWGLRGTIPGKKDLNTGGDQQLQTNKQTSKALTYRRPGARRRLSLISCSAALRRPHPEHSRRHTGIREPVQKRQCGRMLESWGYDMGGGGHDSR